MKRVLVLINGEAGAGKDLFVESYKEVSERQVLNIHRSDTAKYLLKKVGWDGKKTRKVRKLLADIVDFGESTGANNRELFSTVDKSLYDVIFYHSRDTKAMEEIKNHYAFSSSVSVVTLFIRRDFAYNKQYSEEDRWDMKNYNYDRYINNYGTKEDLKEKTKEYSRYIEEVMKW